MYRYLKVLGFSFLVTILQLFFLYPLINNFLLVNDKNNVYAQTVNILPNGDGTITGWSSTGTNYYTEINEGTTPNTSTYMSVPFTADNTAFFRMSSIPDVDSVSQIQLFVYHNDGARGELFGQLFNDNETTTYSSESAFTRRSANTWDSITFSGLSLTQAQLDSLSIRFRAARNGGGAPNDVFVYTVYAVVTYSILSTPPTVELNTDDAYNFGANQTPTLEFTGTDEQGDDITYHIQIDIVDTFNSEELLEKYSDTDDGFENTESTEDTDPFISGETISFTVQEENELDFGEYYWQVRGRDPSGTDTFGDWSETRTFILDPGISIILTSDGEINYGPINAGNSRDTVAMSKTQTVQNNGLATIDLRIKTSNAVGDLSTWTISENIGALDNFIHEYSINSGNNWTLFTLPDEYHNLASGIEVETTQDFDFRVTVPTLVSDYGVKTISITIQAVLP